jgi:hypothetical protein
LKAGWRGSAIVMDESELALTGRPTWPEADVTYTKIFSGSSNNWSKRRRVNPVNSFEEEPETAKRDVIKSSMKE